MRTHLKRKEVDDVLGGKESWANVDKIEGHVGPPFPPRTRDAFLVCGEGVLTVVSPAVCPKCDARKAYFRQLQIRSADEPMTTF